MNVEQLLHRANTQPGNATIYWPGAGGSDPGVSLASDTVKPALDDPALHSAGRNHAADWRELLLRLRDEHPAIAPAA